MTRLNRSNTPDSPVNWKVNLAALWISQFLSLSAFSFCLPFLPLYLKESGIVAAADVPFWAGIFSSAAPISMMIMSPIWGILGDRYGRKMMLVRATLSGSFVLYLMGLVENIEALIVLRMLQGAFTGTVPSAQTLVVTSTPEGRQGFAIGLLMAAVNGGNTAGQFFGGLCAKHYGAVTTFKIAGFLLFVSTIIVMMLVRENFIRPERLPEPTTHSGRLLRRRETITNFTSGLPVLLTVGFIAVFQSYDNPFLSLYVDRLFRTGLPPGGVLSDAEITSRVYGVVGWVGGIASIAAMLGSIAVGAIMDRKLPKWIWAAASGCAVAGLAWICLFRSIVGLTAGRSMFLFFINGLASVIIVILSRMTPSSRRGAALGWSTTARSLGWAVAPVSGAFFAVNLGFVTSYAILAGIGLTLAPIFFYLDKRFPQAFHPMVDDPPSMGTVGRNQVSMPPGQGRLN